MSGRRNPFDELERALERMSQQFDHDLGGFSGARGGIAVDLEEHDDEYVLTADLPGYDREEITVEIADDTLTIAAEREEDREESDADYVRRERRKQSARRTVSLPRGVDEEGANANYQNGVLTVTLPRRSEDGSGRTINIE